MKLLFKSDHHYLVGYYDRNPIRGNKILVHKLSNRQITERVGSVKIGYIEIDNNIFFEIDTTLAWNWQMGSNLTWLNNRKVIYNSICNNKVKSKIYDLKTKKITIENIHFYNCNDKYIVELNYYNISKLKLSYGYQIFGKHNTNPLFKIYNHNLNCLINLEVKKIFNKINLSKTIIEHPILNSKICVFILREKENNKNYLIIVNLITKKIQKIIKIDYISHYCLNEKFLVYYGSGLNKKSLKNTIYTKIKNNYFIKKIKSYFSEYVVNTKLHRKLTNEGLYILELKSFNIEILDNEINYDGHPNFFENDKIIYDTYPNKKGESFIYEYNLLNKKRKILKTIKHNIKYLNKSNRADLHNKINGAKIIIDRFLESRFFEIYKI